MEPGYRRARLNLARVLEEQGELEQALPLVERVVVEWPSHEEALYLLARVLGRLGRADDAELVLERRAEAYAVREVVVALETEMRTGRDRPDLHAEMVALYVRLGDLGMAREAMAAGLSRFPDDPLLRALRQDLPDLLSRRRHPLPYLGDAAPPGPEAGGAPANPVDPR